MIVCRIQKNARIIYDRKLHKLLSGIFAATAKAKQHKASSRNHKRDVVLVCGLAGACQRFACSAASISDHMAAAKPCLRERWKKDKKKALTMMYSLLR